MCISYDIVNYLKYEYCPRHNLEFPFSLNHIHELYFDEMSFFSSWNEGEDVPLDWLASQCKITAPSVKLSFNLQDREVPSGDTVYPTVTGVAFKHPVTSDSGTVFTHPLWGRHLQKINSSRGQGGRLQLLITTLFFLVKHCPLWCFWATEDPESQHNFGLLTAARDTSMLGIREHLTPGEHYGNNPVRL